MLARGSQRRFLSLVSLKVIRSQDYEVWYRVVVEDLDQESWEVNWLR
jgi:predicted lactoylglutathione lyase